MSETNKNNNEEVIPQEESVTSTGHQENENPRDEPNNISDDVVLDEDGIDNEEALDEDQDKIEVESFAGEQNDGAIVKSEEGRSEETSLEEDEKENSDDESTEEEASQEKKELSKEEKAEKEKLAEELPRIFEALVFASNSVVPMGKVRKILPGNPRVKAVRKIAETVNKKLHKENHPFEIVEVSGGFQFKTLPYYRPWVRQLFEEKAAKKLSNPSLECLAVVAYKQPVTKAEIEVVRGVSSDGAIKNLLEKHLVTITGRSEKPGKPLLYGTTPEFLHYFGLNEIEDLPELEEFEELAKTKMSELSEAELMEVGIAPDRSSQSNDEEKSTDTEENSSDEITSGNGEEENETLRESTEQDENDTEVVSDNEDEQLSEEKAKKVSEENIETESVEESTEEVGDDEENSSEEVEEELVEEQVDKEAEIVTENELEAEEIIADESSDEKDATEETTDMASEESPQKRFPKLDLFGNPIEDNESE